MSAPKDTVYVDTDDEITAIIDKVISSDKKIVALVLPKRAAVLQSIVNMKLLKRTTDGAKKNIVLITSETSLLPLAGAVGIFVAKTLQSKPVVPPAPNINSDTISVDQDDIDEVPIDPTKPIGELAEETIEIDNDDVPLAEGAGVAAKNTGKKKIKIPNFDKFRLRIVIGVVALILLIVGWIYAFQVMPKARVVIKTDSNNVDADLTLTASPTAKELNEADAIVPATNKDLKKTDTEKSPATGQLDKGAKATGTVSLKNCSASTDPITIPAGTGVSNSNLTFITNEAVTLPATTLNGLLLCTTPSENVSVTAQNAGDKYNISGGRTFTVAGYSKVSGVDSSPMAGGTSNIVKVVAQKDIDDAKQRITDRSNVAKDELQGDLDQNGFYALQNTFAGGAPAITSSPNVNEEASEVIVSSTVTYTMLGIKKDDLKKLIAKNVESKIDKSKQVILDDGLASAIVGIVEKKPNGDVRLTLKAVVLAGPQLDEVAIKKEIAGKKKGQTISTIKSRPGIKDVEVSYSPFWVSSTPKKASKITVVFEQNNNDSKQ